MAIGVPRQQEAGAAGVVLNHARELEGLGHSVECWFLEDVLSGPAKPKRFEGLIFSYAVARRILRDRAKYDVVNLHAPWGCVYGVLTKLGRPASAPPYVMTMQGSERRYAKAMRLEDRKGLATNFAWKNRAWHRFYHQTMYDLSIRTAERGAIANQEGCTEARRTRKRDPDHMQFVPNGVEERFFLPRDYPERPWPRLLYVGTWLDRKGVHYLAEGFRLLAGRVATVRLTVAGSVSGEAQVKESFASKVRAQVDVIPLVKREEMPSLYAQHDIFVFPSLVEGMPLALLEAMATGMPVVTTNVCGMGDVVEEGANGLLVPPADAESLAAALERLCNSTELRRQIGLQAQETMRKHTWRCVAKQLEAVLCAASNGAHVRG